MTWSLPWRRNRLMRHGFNGFHMVSHLGWASLVFWLRKHRAENQRVETQLRPKLEVKQKDFCVEEFRKNQLQTEDKTRLDAQGFLLTLWHMWRFSFLRPKRFWGLHCHDPENFDHLLPTWKTLWVRFPWSNANSGRMRCLGLKTTRIIQTTNQGPRACRNNIFWCFWCDELI